MLLKDILTPDRCFCDVDGVSKNRLLKNISDHIEDEVKYLQANQIFDSLMSRERLGSTGLGKGIAIPHCRVPSCHEIIGCLITLKNGIDFDAVDSGPVDLLFVLIVPEQKNDEHVQVLGRLAELFNDEKFCENLRNIHDSKELYKFASAY